MRTELPVLRDFGHEVLSGVDFRKLSDSQCSSNARTWRQERSHIPGDEGMPFACARTEWERKGMHNTTRPLASAFVPNRIFKRDELRKLHHSKKHFIDSGGIECNAGDSEQDSLDTDDQLKAFVEYNATDMDNLDINPSQDFVGDVEQDTTTQASQYMQACSWEDATDVNQFPEEASEVFDNTIHAPRPDVTSFCDRATPDCEPNKRCKSGIARSAFSSTVDTISEKQVVICDLSDDSEGSLSDGFDVALNFASKGKATAAKLKSGAKWSQRRSVKRDCSFVANSDSYSRWNRQLLLMPSPAPATTREPKKVISDCVIELKDGCFDLNDDNKKISKRECNVSNSVQVLPAAVPALADRAQVSHLSIQPAAPYIGALQPRLVRKRRKIGQLTLDGFLRLK